MAHELREETAEEARTNRLSRIKARLAAGDYTADHAWLVSEVERWMRLNMTAVETRERIAAGIKRYVLDAAKPFIVGIDNAGAMLAGACLVPRYGERDGQAPRCRSVEEPLPTVVTTGNGAQLVSTFLAKHYGGVVGSDARDPMGTVTSVDHHSLVAAHMTKFYGTSTGSSMDEPVHTVTAGGQDTSSTGLKHGLVSAFLTKYYGSGGQLQGVDEPVHTATGKPRFGLVTVTIQGQPYVIAVIGAHYAERSQATRNRYVQYLKAIFEYGVKHGHIEANPLARWQKGKEQRRKSPLSLDALKKIQASAPDHLAWALEMAWTIPCRPGPSDLYALRFDRNVQAGRGGVEVYHSKVGRWAFITLDPAILRAIAVREKQHRSGHLIEFRGQPVKRLDTALETAAKRAGLPYPVCMYDIRHLWITTALDKGLEPSVIAYMAGTSVEMIHKNYYEPHALERERAASAMPPLRAREADPGRKVVGIDEANVVNRVVKKKKGPRD